MYKLKRMLVWIRRMRHSRGFGVQSPSDYRFIRYVINEHYPYYAYDDLRHSIRDIDQKTRKLCRFYLRVANWRQAQTIVDYQPETEAYGRYMQAGCHRSRLVNRLDGLSGPIELLRMSLHGDYEQFFNRAATQTDSRSVFIIERIKRDKQTEAFWHRVQQDERTGVTFDLYYCGVVFFNHQRYKQSYIVNF